MELRDSPLTGAGGIAAGVALVAATPFALRGAAKLAAQGAGKLADEVKGIAGSEIAKKAGSVPDMVKGVAGKEILDKAGGVPDTMKEAASKMTPGNGGSGDDQATPGVGKGRRMPVQQAVDVGVPLQTAYDQWTQFEEWPQYMHRLVQVSQEDNCTVAFKTKMWVMSKQFTAQIVEQRPDERIQWEVTEGVIHHGVVTFHELAPRLTRVQVSLDVEPGSLVEKAARGMRLVKRAVRADLARFKAYIEMQEEASGGWRGTIRDGKVVSRRESSSSGGGGRSQSRARAGHDGSPRSRSGGSSGRSRSGSSSRRRGSSS
jgi:uncharacterized membrane protein